jgi:hypothetical protein
MVMTNQGFDLSVVLQVGGERERAGNCLESLLRQEIIDRMEIILIDYGLDAFPPLPSSDHPAVRLLPRPAYEPFGQSRALGVREATAPVVAFIEDHCVAFSGWAKAIVDVHSQGWIAIGCEMHTGNPGVGISDAIALMNYAHWLPPTRTGVHPLLVGHNAAYDRELLLSFGEQLPDLLRCDPVLQWKLQEMGYELYLDSRIRIAHVNETELGAIALGYFQWNRLFAPTRAAVFHWPILKRMVWFMLSPLIPWTRLVKLFAYALRARRGWMGVYFRSLPVQFIAQSAAAFGQAVGLALGIGNAGTAFLYYELNQVRRVHNSLRPEPVNPG